MYTAYQFKHIGHQHLAGTQYTKPFEPEEIWLATSDLQKAIRFGLIAQVGETAARLFLLKPEQLMRRLAVIAFEDIGLANRHLAIGVMHLPWKKAEMDMETLVGVAVAMAMGPKSRLLCDIVVGAKYLPADVKFIKSSEIVIKAAQQRSYLSLIYLGRMLSVLDLTEIKWLTHTPGWKAWRAVNDDQFEDIRSIAGIKIIGGLGKVFQILAPIFGKEYDETAPVQMPINSEYTVDGKSKFLMASYDQHTRPGGRAMRTFASYNHPFVALCEKYGIDKKYKREAIMKVLTFRCDGALLNPVPDLDLEHEMAYEIRRHRLMSEGVPDKVHLEFVQCFRDNLHVLNSCRCIEAEKALDSAA